MLKSLLRSFGIKPQPTQGLGDLQLSDEATIRARVALVSNPVLAPITKRPCAFYHLELFEWVNGHKKPFLSESSSSHFVLEDDVTSVMALGSAASTHLKTNRDRGHSSDCLPEIRALSRRHGFSMVDEYGELRSLAYDETLVLPGESILAAGNVSSEVDPGGAASYREQPSRLVFHVRSFY